MAACQVQCWDFETQQQTEKSISSHASIRAREVCIPDHLRAIMISSCWNVVQAPSYNFVDLFCTLYIVCYASYSHIARCSWWRFSELHRFRIGQALSVISTSRLWCNVWESVTCCAEKRCCSVAPNFESVYCFLSAFVNSQSCRKAQPQNAQNSVSLSRWFRLDGGHQQAAGCVLQWEANHR